MAYRRCVCSRVSNHNLVEFDWARLGDGVTNILFVLLLAGMLTWRSGPASIDKLQRYLYTLHY